MRSLGFSSGSESSSSTLVSGRVPLRRVLLALTLVVSSWVATASLSATTAAAVENPPLWQTMSGCGALVPTTTIQATPSDYVLQLPKLKAGVRLQLAAGTYTQGLNLRDKNGQPDQCIIVEGPASGSPPAVFTGSDSWNIVSLRNSSYIAVRNLSLDGQGKGGDGVRGEKRSSSSTTPAWTHHILIDGLSFKNFNANQISGINTKDPAWNWVVRNNTITSTYTGMYFGDSDGTGETANFLVENNLVYDTLGYNLQFKHQLSRDTSLGMPSSGTTIIRNNTFSKENGALTGSLARANLLVDHWPLSGAGSTDSYQIYGNLLWQNPSEGLFQGEGNFSFHDNLLVNRNGDGAYSQPHNDVPKRIDFYNNTVVTTGTGIRITGADTTNYQQRVFGNAVFAGIPLYGDGQQSNNITGTYSAASSYLNNPMAALGSGLDLYPKTGQLQGTAIDYSAVSGQRDYDRDFNDRQRITTYRGAYSGDGVNPGWTPALAIKPQPTTAPPPTGTGLQNGVAVTGISGTTGSQQTWTMTVPTGASNLKFQTTGGTGDADLYVRLGSAPATTAYDCRSDGGTTTETCTFPAPTPGTWQVMIHGYAAYSSTSLTGSYQTSPACTTVSEIEPNGTTAPQPITGPCNQVSGTYVNETSANDCFRISVPAGRTVTGQLYGLSVDYNLFIYSVADTQLVASTHTGTAPEQVAWTNTSTTAVSVDVRVQRTATTQTTYQLGISY
ncbi:pre-peptidase C-terminal domain-containing protein [Jatrophihabitans sp.]|jgi:hypothetical protein|uniref:pre-peptidase C-terminal domain-containing protein n=1 Tax=Jatrophihabitans sp. TaxID=1932789 RepID=UPI002F0974A7